MRILTKTVGEGGQKESVLRLLRWQFQDDAIALDHHPDGKPYLPDHSRWEISISHCRSDVAVALGPKGVRIGIDVEDKRAQTERLSARFCSPPELELIRNGLPAVRIWGAKEACYKAFSDRIRTPFSDITALGSSLDGNLRVKITGIGTFFLRHLDLPSGASLIFFSETFHCD